MTNHSASLQITLITPSNKSCDYQLPLQTKSILVVVGTAIAQWICLSLQSFHSVAAGSNPDHIYTFSLQFQFEYSICNSIVKRMKINTKRAGIGPFKKEIYEYEELRVNEMTNKFLNPNPTFNFLTKARTIQSQQFKT